MSRMALFFTLATAFCFAGAEDGQNYDRGQDCGGSDANASKADWTWGPSSHGCHSPAVGSPGANGRDRMMMLDCYLPGANGPSG